MGACGLVDGWIGLIGVSMDGLANEPHYVSINQPITTNKHHPRKGVALGGALDDHKEAVEGSVRLAREAAEAKKQHEHGHDHDDKAEVAAKHEHEHGHKHKHDHDHDKPVHGEAGYVCDEGCADADNGSHKHEHEHEQQAKKNPAHGEAGHVCGTGCGHDHDHDHDHNHGACARCRFGWPVEGAAAAARLTD